MPKNLDSDIAEEESIVERIYEALVDQRLTPGTKLSEADLCKAFGVGRMRVRRSLLILANRELVDLQPNRGAFVARPSTKQALEIFEARLAIEPALARQAAIRAKPVHIKVLEKHLLMESAAHAAGDRRAVISLSGQFHTVLAQVADNTVMLRIVKDLVTRSSLIIGMFGSTGVTNCRDDEHAEIIQAMRFADGDLAERLMQTHIEHIQSHLNLDQENQGSPDLVSLFKR